MHRADAGRVAARTSLLASRSPWSPEEVSEAIHVGAVSRDDVIDVTRLVVGAIGRSLDLDPTRMRAGDRLIEDLLLDGPSPIVGDLTAVEVICDIEAALAIRIAGIGTAVCVCVVAVGMNPREGGGDRLREASVHAMKCIGLI